MPQPLTAAAPTATSPPAGFHIDPYHGSDAAEQMANFFQRCAAVRWAALGGLHLGGRGWHKGGGGWGPRGCRGNRSSGPAPPAQSCGTLLASDADSAQHACMGGRTLPTGAKSLRLPWSASFRGTPGKSTHAAS